MEISLRTLRYAVMTADCGNITGAARALNITQPSVSAAISELEIELGTSIFIRHHARGVSLTPAGRQFISEARLLLKHSQDFSRSWHLIGDSQQGQINVGCFTTVAARYMPSLLAAFSESHPDISVNLLEGDQQHVLDALVTGAIEVALTYNLSVPAGMDVTTLLHLPPVALLAADHHLAGQENVSMTELAKEPYILYDLPLSREYFMELFRSVGAQPTIAWRSASYEFVRGLVARGHGFAIHNAVPRTMTTYDGGSLIIRPFRQPLKGLNVVCLSLADLRMRRAVRLFADFSRSHLADMTQ